jgi:hypothetical protein
MWSVDIWIRNAKCGPGSRGELNADTINNNKRSLAQDVTAFKRAQKGIFNIINSHHRRKKG